MISFRAMRTLLKAIFSKDSIPLFLVIIFGVLASRSLIFQSGYWNMHDDLQMMRQFQLEKCFLDFQIPCRWVPDMGYGFGFPLFNFYPPLPYLAGEIFRVLGFSFVTTSKLVFAFSFLGSGIAMYFLSRDFFGRVGGALSAIFYIWAPYHSVDIYVRGAMNEAWALIFFPLIFLFGYRLVKSKKSEIARYMAFLAVSYSLLFMSHNLMVLIFTPFFGVWILLHLWRESKWKRIPHLILAGLWSLGLSAFFTLPALLENQFTHVRSQLQGYYLYTAHFVNLNQLLFSRFWGYGPSLWLEDDRMSFQIGHLHWILSLLVGVLLFFRFIHNVRRKKPIRKDPVLLITAFVVLMGWVSAYLTHVRSAWIYDIFTQLAYIQFPWRFLTLVIFAFSFSIGYIPGVIAKWKTGKGVLARIVATIPQVYLLLLLSIVLLIMNWNYFRPEGGKMGPLTDEEKFTGRAWMLQQTAGIYDYLPIDAEMAPNSAKASVAEFMEGEGQISDQEEGTYWSRADVDVLSDEAVMRINTFYFPGWRVFVDNTEVETFIPEDEKWGRMWITLSQGSHLLYAQLYNTPVRTFGNIISIASWSIFGYVIYTQRKQNELSV